MNWPKGAVVELVGGSPDLKLPLAFLLLMLAVVWVPHAHALGEPLYVNVHFNRGVDDGRVTVDIHGQVTGLNQSAVALASVLIRVTDPYESTVHIALLNSNEDGTYSDVFQPPYDWIPGNYTIVVVASKPGFRDAYAKLTFTVGISHLSISLTPASVDVTAGQSATFEITAESRAQSNEPVHIEVVGLPRLASYSLSSNNVTVPSSITLSVQTSRDVEPGSYVFTVIGRSADVESRASAEIVVRKVDMTGYYMSAAILAVTVLLGIVIYRRRVTSKKMPDSASVSPEYVEGLPLSPSTLISLPDHLRKTAVIVCQLGEASAVQVAARSGKTRSAESDYLNQLERMGLLKKKQKGRESYFTAK